MIRASQCAIVVSALLLGGAVLTVGCRSSTDTIAEEEFFRLHSLGDQRLPLTTPNDLVLTNGYFHFIADTAVLSMTYRDADGALVDSSRYRFRLWRKGSSRLVSGAGLPLVTQPDTYVIVLDTLRRKDVPTGYIWLRELTTPPPP